MTRRRAYPAAAALLALIVWPQAAAPDTVQLKEGDRITGRAVAVGKKKFRVATPFGSLLIPSERIEKIVYDDGREEVFLAAPSSAWKVEVPVHLTLVVTGDSFWQAWAPHEAPADATLRLLVSLDEQPVAAYVDPQLDRDLRGAVVNTFAFEPVQTGRTTWDDARALPPETRPGEVHLAIELAAARAGHRRLGLSYQWNAGKQDAPSWRELVNATVEVDLALHADTEVHLEQARGEMSFNKKKMRKTETFQLNVRTPDARVPMAPSAAAP
jgi:hypothetical protein